MGIVAADFYDELSELLPSGPAWETDRNILLEAWADEFNRIQAHADNLIGEADPRTTYDLLADYERIFGLPSVCMYNVTQSVQQRQAALVTQMTSVGGQSIAYFIALALSAGFIITITEFRPFSVGGTVADVIWGPDWAYAWQVNAPAVTVTYFLVTSGVSEPLAAWGNTLLECLLTRFKPAHTVLIFSYI